MKTAALSLLVLLGACGRRVAGAATSGGSSTASSSSRAGSSGSGSSSTSGGSGSTGSSSGGSSSSGAVSLGPSGCFTNTSAGHHQLACDGGVVYDVEIPSTCTQGGCGLVLDVHGLTMNAAEEDQGSGMRALGDQYGYVVIQPTAPIVLNGWNPTSLYGPLLFAFVQSAQQAMQLDPRRLHVMGFSEGGAMTWWMICAHSDVFASAAPLSAGGVIGCTYLPGDVPSEPIPILQAHGELDNVVNFDLNALPQRNAVLTYWGYGPGTVFAQVDGGYSATRYFTDGGIPYEFYEHDYLAADSLVLGGHCQPGGTDIGLAPTDFACASPDEFIWGQVAMQFFLAHPRP